MLWYGTAGAVALISIVVFKEDNSTGRKTMISRNAWDQLPRSLHLN